MKVSNTKPLGDSYRPSMPFYAKFGKIMIGNALKSFLVAFDVGKLIKL